MIPTFRINSSLLQPKRLCFYYENCQDFKNMFLGKSTVAKITVYKTNCLKSFVNVLNHKI